MIWVVDIIQGATLSCPCEVCETCGRGRVFYMRVWFQSSLTLWRRAFQTHTRRESGLPCVLPLACIDASGNPVLFCFFALPCALVMCSSAQCRWWLQFLNMTQLLPLPGRWQQLRFPALLDLVPVSADACRVSYVELGFSSIPVLNHAPFQSLTISFSLKEGYILKKVLFKFFLSSAEFTCKHVGNLIIMSWRYF